MIRSILIFLSLIVITNNSFATCAVNADVFGAVYKVTTIHKDNNTESAQHITLWRNGRKVAHEYPDAQMTEVWEQMVNKKLRMVNYFDTQQRGIEYTPDEIKISHNENDWLLKRQLITNDLMHSMQHITTVKDDCDDLAKYVLEKKDVKIVLQWLVKRELVKQYKEESENSTVTWKLERLITDPAKVESVFIARSKYQTTDYADVGDNESDPFLLKMINLGFIAHGSSGFYDAKGNALGDSHQH